MTRRSSDRAMLLVAGAPRVCAHQPAFGGGYRASLNALRS
jgi:hypothetical protein